MSTLSTAPLRSEAMKLRSSCDSCGTAKVKCDQEQPECGRCRGLRLTCVYGVSRKSGKPPRKRLGDIHAPNLSKRRRTPTGGTVTPHTSMNADNPSHPIDRATPFPDFMGDMLNDDLNEWPLLDDWTTGQQISFGPMLGSPGAAIDSLNLDSESHSCPAESYGIFRDLICPSPSLHVPESNSTTVTAQFDEVLHFNSSAVKRLARLLKCPCAKSGHRAMVHASIVSRILIWYQQAAGWPTSSPSSPQSPPGNEDSASIASGSSVVQATGFAVESAPVVVGTFSVEDQTVQSAIRIQLVLSELRKIVELIDVFRGSGDSDGDKAGGLYSHLGGWLLAEQQRTVRILKSRLCALNRDLEIGAGLE